MLGRRLVRVVGEAVTASALLAGMLGVVGVTAAHAAVPVVELFVAPLSDGGVDAGNNCALAFEPCATIGYALAQEAYLTPDAVGSVINLATGSYDSSQACTNEPVASTQTAGLPAGCDSMFANLTAANSGVTVAGAGITKGKHLSVVAPQNCASLAEVTDPGSPDLGLDAIAAFYAPNGVASITGVTIENMVLAGGAVAGGQCPAYRAAVINTSGEQGSVVGDAIQSDTAYGILTDDDADSSVISNTLVPVPCTTTVKGPDTGLNAGWATPVNLEVKKKPTCAKFIESVHGAANGIFVNGIAYCTTTSATKDVVVITGSPTPGSGCSDGGTPIDSDVGPEIAKGTTVIYNTSVAPFTQFGIACNTPVSSATFATADESTDCTISDNTITAGGTVYSNVPIGIVATDGATADIDGNSVSDVTDVAGDGIGIGLIPNAHDGCSAGASVVGTNDSTNPSTGQGNRLGTTSANDSDIVVEGNVEPGPCSAVDPSYQVNGNTVIAGNVVGIALVNLGYGGGTLAAGEPAANNSVSGVTLGVGYDLEGDRNQVVGGALSTEGNSASDARIGIVLAPCVDPGSGGTCENFTSAPQPSDTNLIQNNKSRNNELYGVMVVGGFQPAEIAAQVPSALAATGNIFNANTWTGNGAGAPLVDGANVMDGTGWGGGCEQQSGDCPPASDSLTFAGTNTTFSPTYPGVATIGLPVCNENPGSAILPAGSEITFNTTPAIQAGDLGTFFVTRDAVITGHNCTTTGPYELSVQALNPDAVGTPNAAGTQPFTLATGDVITVDANGGTFTNSLNTYGGGAKSNGCTPVGWTGAVPGTPPNVFGQTNPPYTQYSTTLEASTGGVNATYIAC